jgi:anti-sigma regulatory factor (Ser/Thr protein kinase)
MLIEVSDHSQAGDARRKAVALAQSLAMDEIRCGEVAIAATEIATNLVKHAGRGYILLQQTGKTGGWGLRLIGVDKGPGIADVTVALRDGHSTADSLGTGLGAVKRLSDAFDVYTVPGAGTVVSAVFWGRKPASSLVPRVVEVACVSEPLRGEEANGDGWAVQCSADLALLMVVDGLGHGVMAAEAAREAERILAATLTTTPDAIVRDLHLALKKTRGAAGAVARVDPVKGLLSFAGVGNISGTVAEPSGTRSLTSHNGTLGHRMEQLQEFTCPWNKESILVMHSDGLITRWDLKRYPGIRKKPASVIAAVLHRDFCRERDDVTVLVAKAA